MFYPNISDYLRLPDEDKKDLVEFNNIKRVLKRYNTSNPLFLQKAQHHIFMGVLIVENTADDNRSNLLYQAQSPDEEALVSASRNFGVVFKSRSPETVTIEVNIMGG